LTNDASGVANSNVSNDISASGINLANVAETVLVEAKTVDGRVFQLPVEYAGASGMPPASNM